MQNIKTALALIANFSEPSKMPCYSYSFSAKNCKTGAKLRNIEGSICSKCYCVRGNYLFPAVKACHDRRLDAFYTPDFVSNFSVALKAKDSTGYFRWFDAGDLQDEEMLQKIVDIAILCPKIKFWLPTKEYSIVTGWLNKGNQFPKNLTVRLSAYMIDGPPPTKIASAYGLVTSTVVSSKFTCLAPKQDGKCLACRRCWNKKVANVAYLQH